MKLKLGISTCPNDTFMFDAMIHGKIDTEGLEFEVVLTDVEELNRLAFNNEFDISKLSYHAFAFLSDKYVLMNSGSALGKNNGPILISKNTVSLSDVNDLTIAIPGKYTSANLLLSIAFPEAKWKMDYLFSEIEKAVLDESVDAGLIIHENRFTYEEKGLKKIIDLGEYWEKETGLPLPLGGIAISRKLPYKIQQKADRVLQRSVEFAFANPNQSSAYVKEYAQEMDEQVIQNHINLYVNNYSVSLGDDGRNAVLEMYRKATELGVLSGIEENIFV